MELKSKKVIAKEIIILACLTVLFFIFFIIIKLINHNIETKKQSLIEQNIKFEKQIDSIAKLPWNLNWNGKRIKIVTPSPSSKDFLYRIKNSKDGSKIKLLLNKVKDNKIEIKNSFKINHNHLTKYFLYISLIIIYPLRALILLLKWSIKILKEEIK
jgi:hypothetical protein